MEAPLTLPRVRPRAVRHLRLRDPRGTVARALAGRASQQPGAGPRRQALKRSSTVQRRGGDDGAAKPQTQASAQTAAWAVDINTRDTRNAGLRYHGVNHKIPEQRRDQASPSSLIWPRLTVIGAVLRIDEDAVAHGHKVRHAQRLAVGEHLPKRVPCGQIAASACLRQAIPSRRRLAAGFDASVLPSLLPSRVSTTSYAARGGSVKSSGTPASASDACCEAMLCCGVMACCGRGDAGMERHGREGRVDRRMGGSGVGPCRLATRTLIPSRSQTASSPKASLGTSICSNVSPCIKCTNPPSV